jgi:hypothetical protein
MKKILQLSFFWFRFMKRDIFFILLSFAVSFLFPLSYSYSCYGGVTEVDFLTNGVKFEVSDIDNLLVDKQINLNFIPDEILSVHSPEIDLHGFPILFSILRPSTDSSLSVLRC